MSVTYKTIANFARELSKQKSEIHWRNSVARAYYAAYHKALEAAEFCPQPSPDIKTAHAKLKNRFEREGSSKALVIAQSLFAMKRQREISEYKLRFRVSKSDAEMQISIYDEVAQVLDEFVQQSTGRHRKL